MTAASLLLAVALLLGQASGQPVDQTECLPADRAEILNYLEELSEGDLARYANEVKTHSVRLSHRELAPHLVRLVLSDNPRVRDSARSRLWQQGRDGELTAAMAYAITGDLCVAHMEWLVGQVRADHVYALCFVRDLRSHEHARVRIAAWDAIVRTETGLRDTIPRLMEIAATDPDVRVRRAVVQILGRLGPRAKAAVAGLLALLETDEDLRVRLAATDSLQKIERENRPLIQSMERCAADLRSQISDAEFRRIISELESLIAAQDELQNQAIEMQRRDILAPLY